ncbi:replication-relaxation family protein [Kitasatospora sp. NPDC101155]|uniref:replication-relaxation family protein n=1 Tax=Kitasatospora sp. NPDC101155 TaxID=3364097 RepID=UPI0038064783
MRSCGAGEWKRSLSHHTSSRTPHAMAANETVFAFVLGRTAPRPRTALAPCVPGRPRPSSCCRAGNGRCARTVWQAAEIGVPVLMVEVDRSTMAPARVAVKFTAYRELFRTRVRDSDPARSGEERADRRCTGGAVPTPATPAPVPVGRPARDGRRTHRAGEPPGGGSVVRLR